MKAVLARKLIEAKGIRAGSECEFVIRPGSSMLAPGHYTIQGARVPKEGGVIFDVVNHRGEKLRVDSTLIHSIDGMTITRLASIFNMNENGDPIPVGKRRGRKPRARVVEPAPCGWDCDEEEEVE